jgi:L-Ala-D/L-Glu epimerase / N-acetyl-D-glutamate racemase
MGLTLRHEVLALDLRDPFRIARDEPGAERRVTTVVVEVRDDRFADLIGVGEGYPTAYYGETPGTMAAVFPALMAEAADVFDGLADVTAARERLVGLAARWAETLYGHGAAKCAVDIALHDLAGKILGVPVLDIVGLPAGVPPTDFTIGIDDPGVVAERASRVADFPALKIKCGGPADLETLQAVRGVYPGPIRVDANTGWTRSVAETLLPELIDMGVELIEQPFPARAYRDLGWLQERSDIPIVADESAVTREDLDALDGVVAGVNVKLAKCGGIAPARIMLEEARARGFRTFIGCMEETSVAIAASVAVASLADWVDLDGNLLLAADPFAGLELGSDKRWRPSGSPGLGLHRVAV